MKKIYGFLLYFLTACIYFASVCYSISYGASSAVVLEPALSITASGNGYVCTGTDLTLSSSVSGGSSPYTYSWSGPNSFSSTQANPTVSAATTAASGSYFLTVTDHVSNTATSSTSVTVSDCHVTMSLQNCSQPAPNIIQFDLYAVSDGAAGSDLRANSFQYGINFNTGILQPSATASLSYVSGTSDFIPPLNSFTFPSSFYPDHLKILQAPYQGANLGNTMALGHQYKVGTFRFTSSSNLVSGSSPNFSLQNVVVAGKLVCAEVVWFGSSTQTSTISDDGSGNNQRTVSVNCSITLNTCGFTASTTSTPVSECNGSNGTATVSTTGGFSPFQYIWNNGQTTSTATGLTQGSYTVTITDAISCTATASVNVTQPSALSITCGGSNVSCNQGNDGTVSVTASGGGTPYSYLWSSGQTTSALSSLSAAIYTVTVTDAGGCSQACSVTINPCNHLTLSLQNCVQTSPNVLQLDLYVVSDGSLGSDLRANSFQYGINFDTGILQSGATILASYVNGTSDLIPPLNGFTFPSTTSPDHIRIVQSVYSGANTGTTMVVGHQYKVGTFLLTGSANWVNGSSPNFALQSTNVTNETNTGGLVWIGSAVVATNFFTTGTGNGQRSLSVSCSTILNTCGVSASAIATPDACFGGSNGTATISAFGGWPPYSYLWSNGQTTSTATGLTAGGYSVTVTDAISCTFTASAAVTQPTALSAGSSVITNISCNSGSNGSVSVSASGGTSPCNGTGAFTGLSAGSYTYIITDANGCTATTIATITQPSALSASSSVITNVSCNGGNNGSVSVAAVGGTSPYSGTGTFTGLTAGAYTYTVTDSHGCTATTTFTITEPPGLTVSCSGTNVSCSPGNDGSVSISASGGTPAYVYLWSNGGTSSAMSGLTAGVYSVTVTDTYGCTATCSFTVKPCNHLTLSLQNCVQTATNVVQFDLYVVSDGSFESDLRANSFQYGVNFNTGILQSGATIAASYVNGTSDLIPPLNGFTFPSTSFPDHIRIVQSVYSGSNTGTKMIVGHQYKVGTFLLTSSANWVNNSGPNFALQSTNVTNKTNTGGLVWIDSSVVATNFFTTGTGNGQRSVLVSCSITLNTCTVSASATSTPVTCSGGSNGTATVSASGGWLPYSYLWSNGQTTTTITGLTAGIYSVTVTDAISCTATTTATVIQPTALSASSSVISNVSCHGGSNGSVSVAASGGTSPYSGTGAFTGLSAGTHTYIVTDANGCTATTTATVTEPTALSASSSVITNVSCHGGSNGSVSVAASGGTSPYNGTGTFTGLSAGSYTYTVTDANGCTATTTATVTEPTALSASSSVVTNVSCHGGSNGSVSVAASGGTSPYNGTGTFTGLSAGSYTYTVTDANGCTATTTAPVTEPTILSASSSVISNVSCHGGSNGSVSVAASGGTSPYSGTGAFTGLSDGTHTYIVTDANGCTATTTATVTEPTALSASSSVVTNVSCHGGSNGSVSVAASGGTSPYNGTGTFTGLSAGSYTYTVTDANGCTATTTAPVTEPTILSASSSVISNVSCHGGSNGSVSVAASGGTSPYSGTGAFTGLSAGTHTYIVTDANGCTATTTATVTEPTALSASSSVITNVSCHGGSNGSVSVAASGGTSPYNGTGIFTGLSAGSYTYTVTDTNGCTATTTITVTEPTILSANSSVITNVSCHGGSNGSVSVAAIGGTSPYNGTGIFTGLSAGSYTYTITDANGCTGTTTVTVTEPTALSANSSVITNVSCHGGSNGSVSVAASGGTSPYNGTGTFTGLSAGSYTYTVTDANGCTATTTAPVTEPTILSASSSVITNVSCHGGSNGSVSVAASGGTSPYSGTGTFTGQSAGGYTYTVTDANGCTATTTATVTEPTILSASSSVVTNVSCHGGSNGSVSVAASGGTSPYNGTGIFTGLSAGSYTYTVTDTNGCTGTTTITVTEPTILSASSSVITNVSCHGGSNGSVSVAAIGGTSPYSGTGIFTGLSAGSYTYTVTDANGCTGTTTVTVTEPTALSANSSVITNVSCHGGSNGSVSVAAIGGTSPYSGTGTFTGQSAGSYTYTVTDANGCTATTTATVTEPTILSASSSVVTNVSCHGGSNGSVSVAAIGGTSPYSGTGIFTGLSAGSYTYTVTDANGCMATTTVTVTEPTALSASSSVITNVSCHGGSNGSVSIAASGGTSPYNGTGIFTGLSAGSYTYTVTDANGCMAVTTAPVTEPTALSANSSVITNVSCHGGSNGSVSVAASGGTSPYSGTGTFTGLSAGSYTYTITDANGCTGTTTVTVTEPTTLLVSCSGSDASCNIGNDGSASVTASGGIVPYSYLWSNGQTTSSVSNLTAGTYSVTVADAHGCTNTCAYTVNACNHLTMSLQNCSQPTCNAIQFDLYVVSDGSPGSDLRANAFQYGINFNTSVLQSGATITPSYVSGSSDFIPPLGTFNFPASGSPDHIRIVENPYTGSNTGTTMAVGHQYKVGTFTLTSSAKWVANSNPSFALQASAAAGKTVSAAVVWIGNATLPVTISNTGTGNDQRGVLVSCSLTLNPCNLVASASSTPVSCFGGSNGTATVSTSGGCNPSFQYLWSNGQTTQTATNLTAGSYSVTVTSDLACTATTSITVTQPTQLTASQTHSDVSCHGGSNGTATITASGGTSPYSGTGTFTGLSAGNYTYIVTDANNCTTTTIVTVTEPAVLSASQSNTNVSCHGGSNGTATVSANGGTAPYSGTGAFTGLSAGSYSYTVTDAHGCISTTTVTITQPAALSMGSCSHTDVSCFGGSNGTASAGTITNAVGTVNYLWSNGQITSTATGLSAGTYALTVSDNCLSLTCSQTLSQPTALLASCSGTDVSCSNGSDGSVSISASGGTPSYSYLWSNGATTSSVTNLGAATYSVTVTDAHGCTATCSYTVNACNHLTMSLQNCSQPTCNTIQFDLYVESDGSPTSDLRANAFQYGINFNTGILQSGATITPSYLSGTSDFIPPLGTFNFPAASSADHIRIVENPYTGVNTGTTMTVGHQYKVGTFTLTSSAKWVINSNPAFALQATAAAGKTVSAAVVWMGNATLPVTISNTGTGSGQRSVVVSCSLNLNPCNLSSSIASTNVSCNGGSNGTATVSTSGGCNPSLTYLWSNGQTAQTATGLSAGSYSVTVTGDLACTATASVTLTQPTAMTVSCGGTNASCNGGSDGSASVTASGGSPSYSYLWSNGGTGSSISGLTATTYSVTVSDANGCSASCSYTVTENPCPFTTLNLTVFLEGIYTGSSTMRTTLYNLNISNDSTACDTIEVNLWRPDHLANASPDYSVKTILHSNGSASMTYPAAVTGNNWYIAVKHRSSIETWSGDSIAFTSVTSYNFSDNILKAYNNGLNMPMKHLAPVFAFYSGDINQDGTVDVSDMAIIDNDASQFLFGYNASDCNGDGATDITDMSLVDNNTQLMLFFARPY